MNVTFYLALHRDGGELVSLTSTLTINMIKLSKFLASMGYHVYHIFFTNSDMLRIRLSHKIEAL